MVGGGQNSPGWLDDVSTSMLTSLWLATCHQRMPDELACPVSLQTVLCTHHPAAEVRWASGALPGLLQAARQAERARTAGRGPRASRLHWQPRSCPAAPARPWLSPLTAAPPRPGLQPKQAILPVNPPSLPPHSLCGRRMPRMHTHRGSEAVQQGAAHSAATPAAPGLSA